MYMNREGTREKERDFTLLYKKRTLYFQVVVVYRERTHILSFIGGGVAETERGVPVRWRQLLFVFVSIFFKILFFVFAFKITLVFAFRGGSILG